MNAANQWALTVAVTTIVSGVILTAIPPGKLKKSAGYAVALVVIACFFLPLAGGLDLDFEAVTATQPQENTQPLESYVDESVIEYAAFELEAELVDCCGAKGFKIDSADVLLTADENRTVTVHSVTVSGNLDEDGQKSVKDIVHELFGEAVTVVFE